MTRAADERHAFRLAASVEGYISLEVRRLDAADPCPRRAYVVGFTNELGDLAAVEFTDAVLAVQNRLAVDHSA